MSQKRININRRRHINNCMMCMIRAGQVQRKDNALS